MNEGEASKLWQVTQGIQLAIIIPRTRKTNPQKLFLFKGGHTATWMTPDHRRTASARTHAAQMYCKLPATSPCHAPSPWLTLTPKRKGARFPFKFPPLILLMSQHMWKPANDPYNSCLGTWRNAHWELDQTDGISLVISAAYSRDQADLPWWPRSN